MRCPHCSIDMHPVPASRGGFGGGNRMWYATDDRVQHIVEEVSCPACHGSFLKHADVVSSEGERGGLVEHEFRVGAYSSSFVTKLTSLTGPSSVKSNGC